MSNRKSMFFYALLFVLAGTMVGLVIASRLDLAPSSSAQTVAAPPMNSAPITGPLTSTTFREVAKTVTPAVVNIRTESRQRTQDLSDFFGGGGGGGNDLLERFFGQPAPGTGGAPPQGRGQGQGQRPPREQVVQSAGTGFIIDKSGLILTNNHVVEGASKIAVTLYGEDEDQEYEARVVGRDELTDSALIELTEKPDHELPVVRFGDSSQMQPGDWVMAMGNPLGFEYSVTVGVVSGKGRSLPQNNFGDFIQTDAAIYPGNSGGPLFDLAGEVVGVNTAVIPDTNLGFAVPINSAKDILPQLLEKGKVVRGYLGVSINDVTDLAQPAKGVDTGAAIMEVHASTPAEQAGLKVSDVVVAFDGKPVATAAELTDLVTRVSPGARVTLGIVRDGKSMNVDFVAGALPASWE